MFYIKSPSQRVKVLIGIIVVLFIVGYTLFEARGLIFGPRIIISGPENGIHLTEPTVRVFGTTRSVTDITINGRTIALHEDDSFSNVIALKAGYNIVVLEARDRFGRTVTHTLQLMHTREAVPPRDTPSLPNEYGTEENN